MIEVAATTSLPQTSAHTPARTLLLLPVAACMCSPLARSHCISQSSCDCSSPFSSAVSPFLSPCNLTLSTLVSRLLGKQRLLAAGTRFSCLNLPSSVFYLSEYLNTHSSSTHSHVFLLPHNLLFRVWFLRTYVFLENIPPSCSFLLSLLKSRTCFPLSNLRLISFPAPASLSSFHSGKQVAMHITASSEKNKQNIFYFFFYIKEWDHFGMILQHVPNQKQRTNGYIL